MPKAFLAVVALALATASPRVPARAPDLRSFYIGSSVGFGLWSHDIVSVDPVGPDSRVRAMRVISVSESCPQVRVAQAAERLVRHATVQGLARLPICDITQQRIDRAVSQSKTP